MGWAGQTWIEVIQEGTGGANYATFNASPTTGQVLYPTIYGGDAFTAREVPARQVIRTADAGNRRKMAVANFKAVAGRFNTLIHPDQAAYWIAAATALANDANGHPCLPSYSFLYWDSIQAWKLLGGVCRSATFTWSADQDYGTLSMDWIFQRRDATFTTFAQPAESNYSNLVPYAHVESAGAITLGGSAITKYRSCNITINNVLAATRDELPYISAIYYSGRDLDWQIGPQYLATVLRGDFVNQTALTMSFGWARTSPAHALTFDVKTNNYISNVDDNLPLDGPGYQNISGQCFFDASNTTDFTVTAT